jgi:hypothetical protein
MDFDPGRPLGILRAAFCSTKEPASPAMKRIRGSRAPNPVAEPNPHGRILVTWALNHDCDCLEDKRTVLGGSRTVRHHCDAVGGGAVFLTYIAARPRRRVWSGEPRDALGYHHHDFGGLEQVATVSFVNNESKKITLAEMRPSGVRGLLIYCSDYRCSHSIQTATDQLRQISLGFLKIKSWFR